MSQSYLITPNNIFKLNRLTKPKMTDFLHFNPTMFYLPRRSNKPSRSINLRKMMVKFWWPSVVCQMIITTKML